MLALVSVFSAACHCHFTCPLHKKPFLCFPCIRKLIDIDAVSL
uniref:Uncharacterized protein n=1 Tax=Arundo donax TaxID=35708 RepID=A0A0A8ZLR0_ARUDO